MSAESPTATDLVATVPASDNERVDLDAALRDINRFLQCPTPQLWLQQAITRLPELLIDHANCEKKAASTALSLTYRYALPESALLALSKLAREELRHFEQVLALMPTVGVCNRPLTSSSYASELRKLVATSEPARLVDTLLVCAIVEARSCERFSKLVPVLSEALSRFYARLLMSEARHYQIYLDMAQSQASANGLAADYCQRRLLELLTREAQVVRAPAAEFRFHSGPLADL